MRGNTLYSRSAKASWASGLEFKPGFGNTGPAEARYLYEFAYMAM
jgi:hypothetical protein